MFLCFASFILPLYFILLLRLSLKQHSISSDYIIKLSQGKLPHKPAFICLVFEALILLGNPRINMFELFVLMCKLLGKPFCGLRIMNI